MILFQRDWCGPSWAQPRRALQSLGLFAGQAPNCEQSGTDFLAELASPRARPVLGWRAARFANDSPALFSGWLDNAAELASELGLSGASPARIYAEAYSRWGTAADRRAIGCYAAVLGLPDGRVRLSRSPWGGRSLFYHNDGDVLLACSIPRPLFAAGLDKQLRPEAIDRLIAMELPDQEESLFANLRVVPQGSEVIVARGQQRTQRWYDPLDLAPVRFKRDDDYVEAAEAHLSAAVKAALAGAKRPGVALSGGLDSALVCAEMLRQLPPGERLPSFTFHPCREFDGQVPPGKFGDDRPWVEAFARMHPALDPHFSDNPGISFEDRAEQVFAACDAGYPSRVMGTVHHGPMRDAAAHGCDWLLGADTGNMTFSNSAIWAAPEFLRQGKWLELLRLVSGQAGNHWPVWRRIAAQGLMPNLPPGLQHSIRRLMGKDHRDMNLFANPFIRSSSRLAAWRDEAAIANNMLTVDRTESRAAYIRANYDACSLGLEVVHGHEQVFGIGLRDVTAYRPLIEFCLALPTAQFVRAGESRWLARRMAKGRMPEAQRTNRLYGEHNSDWHQRLGAQRAELRRAATALRDHPQLGAVLDVAAMERALDDWPAQAPQTRDQINQLRFYLPAMLYVARFVDHTTGRNQP
ncbi:MAG: asparagine synthase-related protein [Novosphingobium sp.]|uniref:asparagine synthase-related protein n=1 Tax=Novosphingobium sp. TaxID=1874826 RepID=UPI0032BBC6E3